MEIEINRMNRTIKGMERKIKTTRWIIEECKRQELAEKREQILLDRRSRLMGKVAQTEDELQEALEHRKITMADIIKTGLRKVALEKVVQALQNKINFFWNDLGSDPNALKTWRENLRPIRSQNDMHKAVPKPPLFPILDFEEDEIIWQAEKWSSEELQDDNVVWQSQENVTEIATYL
ncbi:uncharacterized protein [Montipora foliosa]|uniref:uncharacterized protein n=1 Tax=Montipora foliosa TaxID=591990 RepID=UPI0035F15D6F